MTTNILQNFEKYRRRLGLKQLLFGIKKYIFYREFHTQGICIL